LGIILTTLLAFGATILSVAVLVPVAKRLRLVDDPSVRKQHEGSIPLVGGIAIWLAFSLCMLFIGLTSQIAVLILAGSILTLVGAIDDAYDLSPNCRLLLQIGIALLACLVGGIVVTSLGELIFPGVELQLSYLAIPFTVFAIVGLINATNMVDGLDGLCGVQMIFPFAGLAIIAGISGDQEHFLPLLVMCGCLLGFLVFNLRTPWRKRATVFLGDAGSGLLGFVLAWFLIDMSQGQHAVIQPVVVLWFTVLLIFDSLEVIARRILRGESPFVADREHLHHVFLLANFTERGTVLILGALTLVGVTLGITSTLIDAPGYSLFAIFILVGILFVRWMVRTWSVMRFLRRSICRRRENRRMAETTDWSYSERRDKQTDRRQAQSTNELTTRGDQSSIS
jgi:UDP-GlcNAc:undecaprenyl-phosphate GlcNAc-1-phosphate transferase